MRKFIGRFFIWLMDTFKLEPGLKDEGKRKLAAYRKEVK